MPISIKEKILKSHTFISEKARGANALKPSYSEEDQLCKFIDEARSELELAVMIFNELTDDKAIDYASYNLLAARAKYSYLLQIAKDKKLSL